jgi:hypothetical protein
MQMMPLMPTKSTHAYIKTKEVELASLLPTLSSEIKFE